MTARLHRINEKRAVIDRAYSAFLWLLFPYLSDFDFVSNRPPLFLADSGNRQQFLDTLEAVVLFAEIDNPPGESGADARQSAKFLDGGRVQVDDEKKNCRDFHDRGGP